MEAREETVGWSVLRVVEDVAEKGMVEMLVGVVLPLLRRPEAALPGREGVLLS